MKLKLANDGVFIGQEVAVDGHDISWPFAGHLDMAVIVGRAQHLDLTNGRVELLGKILVDALREGVRLDLAGAWIAQRNLYELVDRKCLVGVAAGGIAPNGVEGHVQTPGNLPIGVAVLPCSRDGALQSSSRWCQVRQRCMSSSQDRRPRPGW